MYTKEVLDHFENPRNVGEIKDADGVGEVGNLKCGDVMRVFIKIKTRKVKGKSGKEKVEDYISDIKFKTLGCAAAIAASSMMTELAKGKSLESAEKITRDDINDSLGKLPAQKYHCSILSADAIKKAIEDYKRRLQLK
ncbi:MAG: NifU-like protein [bacterium ADurb.Bin212]|nr:MAG: NifU-like protein [bacterium ADurb.Bin212]